MADETDQVDWQLADDDEPPQPEVETESQPQEEPEPAAPAPAAPPAFDYNDRLMALGYSTSGKSELLNVIFSGLRCQRLLIDTKPEFHIEDLEPVHEPEAIDWTAPLIHYQPAPGSDHRQYEPIFQAAFTRRGLVVCAHELGALVDYNAQRAGRYLISYLSQGARLGLGALVGTQRPVWIPVSGQTEAQHVVVFVPQLARAEDNKAAADNISPVEGQTFYTDDLLSELAALGQQSGTYSFLWKDRKTGLLHSFGPLDERVRQSNIVQRLEDA